MTKPSTTAIVTWAKDWSSAQFVDPAACPHPGSAALAVGLDLVRTRPNGPSRIEMRCSLCMLCGTDSTGQMQPDDALQAAWLEHGWHQSTGERLLAFTRNPLHEGDTT